MKKGERLLVLPDDVQAFVEDILNKEVGVHMHLYSLKERTHILYYSFDSIAEKLELSRKTTAIKRRRDKYPLDFVEVDGKMMMSWEYTKKVLYGWIYDNNVVYFKLNKGGAQ